jgi:hypothetical protein
MSSEDKKLHTSIYWYVILPICVLILLGFFVFVLFNMSSVQLIGTERVFKMLNKLPRNIR